MTIDSYLLMVKTIFSNSHVNEFSLSFDYDLLNR